MGHIIWQGPSVLDGQPIAAVLIEHSSNTKTGQAQLYILRTDVPPTEAQKTGANKSICGECPHLLHDTCYVVRHHGSLAVYKALHRGSYKFRKPGAAGRGLDIRLGADGDPTAVPIDVTEELISGARDWTGFTHQWRTCDPQWKEYLRASVENEAGYREAVAAGWLTYRTRAPWEPHLDNEVTCPASAEAGKLTKCEFCHKCKGTAGRSRQPITILAHGSKAKRFNLLKQEGVI